MRLKSLFTPKWQHKNPDVRRQAVQALSAQGDDGAILRELAQQDPVADLRGLALRRLDELDLWLAAARQETDASLRELAWARVCEQVAGKVDAPLPFAARLERLETLADDRLSIYVVRQGAESALRRAALARLGRESVCAERVLNDPDPELRLEALTKVEQRATLERLLKGVRSKDKRVAAAIKTRLEALREADERPQRLHQQGVTLCGRMKALHERTRVRPDWDYIQREFAATEAQWQEWLAQYTAQAGEPEDALTKRYAQVRERLAMELRAWQEAQAKYAPARSERHALLEAVARLLSELQQQPSPTDSDVAHALRALAVLRDSWQGAGVLERQEQTALEEQFQRDVGAAQAQVDDMARYRDATAVLPALLERAAAMLTAPVDETALRALESECAAVAAPLHRPPPSPAAELPQLLASLRQRLSAEREQRRARIEQAGALVMQRDAALTAGQLQEAERLHKRAQERLGELDEPALRRRIQHSEGRLRELRDWRGWGNISAKEQLCEEAEALLAELQTQAGGASDWDDIAQRVQQLQENWKKLVGPARGEKALWERFHAACTATYAPCRAHFAAQALERAANLERQQALCAHVEALAPATEGGDWDISATQRALRDAETQWRQIGAVKGKHTPTINARYRAALARVRAAIKIEKERHQASKQALVQRIEMLVQDVDQGGDLRAATEQAKAAQRQWKTIGPALNERALWESFRAACNALFARRQQAVEAQQQARADQRQARLNLCTQLESIATQDLHALRRQLDQCKAQWRGLDPLPKQDAHALESRFRAACARAEHALDAGAQAQRDAARDQFQRKAAHCMELEQCAAHLLDGKLTGERALSHMQESAARWAQFPVAEPESERRLQQRYQQASAWVQSLANGDGAVATQMEEARRQNQLAKEELCLRLEILAGVESPPHAREARMAYQVAQLAQRLRAGEPQARAPEGALALQEAWYLIGFVPDAVSTNLEQRFAAAAVGIQ